MKQLVEDAIPKVFSELDPHSVYIPAKDAQRANEDLEGSFSGIGVSFNMQTDTILVINVIPGGPSEKAGLKPSTVSSRSTTPCMPATKVTRKSS